MCNRYSWQLIRLAYLVPYFSSEHLSSRSILSSFLLACSTLAWSWEALAHLGLEVRKVVDSFTLAVFSSSILLTTALMSCALRIQIRMRFLTTPGLFYFSRKKRYHKHPIRRGPWVALKIGFTMKKDGKEGCVCVSVIKIDLPSYPVNDQHYPAVAWSVPEGGALEYRWLFPVCPDH